MMDKEHVIKSFGVPDFTVSKGSSGGAYTSLQVADAFRGLFDGVLIGATFPDALSIALSGLDAHLLAHYVADHPGLTDAQKVAVSGYKSLHALHDAAGQAQRADPMLGRTGCGHTGCLERRRAGQPPVRSCFKPAWRATDGFRRGAQCLWRRSNDGLRPAAL